MRVVSEMTRVDGIYRGTVIRLESDGTITVELVDRSVTMLCQVLDSAEAPHSQLSAGDPVLVWTSGLEGEAGVVLGRLGRRSQDETSTAMPDEIVLEARTALTLKVGDGSITIREDGRVLIKGKDLVSHAKRMNRIRGGSVTIN